MLWKIEARAQKHDEVARPERQALNMSDWYAFPEEPVEWLVEGLITTDDCAAANGKPKSGKSTSLLRNLPSSLAANSSTEMSASRPKPDVSFTSILTAKTDPTE